MYGLIGKDVSKSFSKIIHESLVRNYKYHLMSIEKKELDKLFKERTFSGLNVTIPYKQTVLKYIDIIDEKAKKINAVNTVVNKNGLIYGYNTDYDGFLYTIKKHQIDVSKMKVLVIGNGGASQAIQCVLKDLNVLELVILLNNKESLNDIYSNHTDCDLIINTSPVGMSPNVYQTPIDITLFNKVECVIDIIYRPLKTQLLLDCEKRNIKAINGLEMLVVQAIKSLEIFKSIEFGDIMIENTVNEVKKLNQNLVFIGMPGCGKTSISNYLSSKLNVRVYDTDKIITNEIGMEIKEYFNKYSEKEFRKIEREVVKKVSMNNGCIISCGGGIILDENNIEDLRRNGIIIYLDRDLDKIIINERRPLINTIDDLKNIYENRKDLYYKYSDIIIENNGNEQDCLKKIINKLNY